MSTIELILYPLIFLVLWINSFFVHEFWHGLENHRQTGRFGKIGVSIHSLTMWHEPEGIIYDNNMYFLMGGLGSGITMLLFSVLVYPYVLFTLVYMLWIVGVVNIVYSVYECKYLLIWGNNKKFRIGRYSIYTLVVTIMVVIYLVLNNTLNCII